MTWYISDFGRWKTEREGLERLGITADWFAPIRWRIDDQARLVLDAEISAGGRVWPVFLRFPEFFPNTPPSVFPRGDRSRWSSHQYGAGGELCLEYGPDNWTPDLTGVALIESAYRLLEGEYPATGQPTAVPSRHFDTLGQQFRSTFSRLVMTRGSQAALSAVALRTPATGTMSSAYHKEVVVHAFKSIAYSDGTTWTDAGVPAQLAHEYHETAVALYRIEEDLALPPTSSLNDFRSACEAFGFSADKNYAVIVRGAEATPYFLWEKDNSATEIAVIAAQSEANRLDEFHSVLPGKKVALVGCGSVGSKIGTMLARAGVGYMLLVDDDLLLPDNLVRHDLDWRDVGTHKVRAMARRLELANPAIETRIWQTRLASQSSSASAETILGMLGDCDLIVDATANPDVLNLLSPVAVAKSRPVVWAEVFGGGIGGLIARFRPGIEPQPQYMRRAIENWFGEQNTPPVRAKRSYETGGDGEPLIADDADVSVIAANAARMAIDLLMREASSFPHSVYAIGLGRGSVFTQPFDTRPIDVGPPPVEPPRQELSEQETAAEIAGIVELYKARADEIAAANSDSQTPQA